MQVTDVRGWTDVQPDTRFRNAIPNHIITADEIANGEYDSLLGDFANGGMEREVIYDDGTTKPWMSLTLYVHPAGAGALAIDPAGAAAALPEGRLLGEDGAYVGDAEDVDDIAGMLFSHYTETSSFVGSSTANQPVWSTSLAEGDAIWLVRRVDVELHAGSALADGNRIVSDISGGAGTPSGCARPAVATIANQAEVQETVTGYGGKCIGVAKAVVAQSNIGRCKLDLPRRMYR